MANSNRLKGLNQNIVGVSAANSTAIATHANSIILNDPATTWFVFTSEVIGFFNIKSRRERISKLKVQLPTTFPNARSGAFTTTIELTPVTSSGNEVTVAIRINPIHALLKPVSSANRLPCFESCVPLNVISTAQTRNPMTLVTTLRKSIAQ